MWKHQCLPSLEISAAQNHTKSKRSDTKDLGEGGVIDGGKGEKREILLKLKDGINRCKMNTHNSLSKEIWYN